MTEKANQSNDGQEEKRSFKIRRPRKLTNVSQTLSIFELHITHACKRGTF